MVVGAGRWLVKFTINAVAHPHANQRPGDAAVVGPRRRRRARAQRDRVHAGLEIHFHDAGIGIDVHRLAQPHAVVPPRRRRGGAAGRVWRRVWRRLRRSVR